VLKGIEPTSSNVYVIDLKLNRMRGGGQGGERERKRESAINVLKVQKVRK